MPSNLHRFQHSGQSHFVTFGCYHRRQLLARPESRYIFECALERVRRRFDLYIYGYVVMPDHVHLLTSEPAQQLLQEALKSLKQSVFQTTALRSRALLAGALLRLQHTQRGAIQGEATLYPPQPGAAWALRLPRSLGVEQLSSLLHGNRRTGGNRIALDCRKARASSLSFWPSCS